MRNRAARRSKIILSVKGGDLKATDVRDLRGVIEREKAEIGVLLTLEEPTKPMRAEAASAGCYKQPVVDQGASSTRDFKSSPSASYWTANGSSTPRSATST